VLRDLGVIAAFVLMTALPFLGKAYHIDEPAFLSLARAVLRDPRHPLAFSLNWYGYSVPMSAVNAYPTVLSYLLAAVIRFTHEVEWLTRLTFVPFELAAAASLYLLARRWLARPLWPTLTLLAGPAYLINMQHLMPDVLIAALGLAGLWAFLRALDQGGGRWLWGSAALLSAAMLAKFTIVFLLPVVVYCGRKRALASARLAAYLAIVLSPLAFLLAREWMTSPYGGVAQTGLWYMNRSYASPAGAPINKLRSLAAFLGGCAPFAAIWALAAMRSWRRALGLGLAALLAAAVLFLPALDRTPLSAWERGTGILFAAGGLAALWAMIPAASRPDRRPLLLWAAVVAALQLACYWSIVSRYVLFLIMPMGLALAAALEESCDSRRLRWLHIPVFGLTLLLSLGLALVDRRYAGAQRDIAAMVGRDYVQKGRKVWFTGHWGLQYYMERLGASGIDIDAGGWKAVHPGDMVVVPGVNSNMVLPPASARVTDSFRVVIPEPIPLRLIYLGQAGFYSNSFGILPFAFDRRPVDIFRIARWEGLD
jgi:4-amino-4-deoxy-L-arabinose transferase-like glycosyltransferase